MGIKATVDIGGLIFGCWDRCSTRATSICQLEKNLEKLQRQREALVAKRNDLMRKVSHGEGLHMVKLEEIEVWRAHVDASIAEADKLLSNGPQEIQKLCLGGCCSKNCLSGFKFASKVIDRLEDVTALYSKSFDAVAQQRPAVVEAEIPGDQPVGLETMFDKIWRCLLEENIGIMGLWGLGGVGKTTLVKQIYKQFSATRKDFELIWVVVSKAFSLDKVQEDIGEKLGLCNDEQWKRQSLERKAASIFNVLLSKKFVLILDDIWQSIDLEKVGVPRPNKQSGSKIVFTTRSENICGNMGAKRIVKVDPLSPEQAWELFKDNVGEDILEIPGVLPLAREVAGECGGLPLALITISRAMARKKTRQEWNYALQVLRNCASNLEGMEDRVLSKLKFSYDNLPDDIARSCFLYCSLFPEDYLIVKDDIIDYLICEGLIKKEDDGIDLRNKGYNDIGNLVRACLLEEERECVKMHDVIRDMALWITRDHEVAGERFFVKTGAGLTKFPNSEEWQGVKRMSLMRNRIKRIEEVPVCPNLSTLLLCDNPLEFIRGDFFQFMDALTVLDLSHTGIWKLPSGITKLVSLQCLDLSRTLIRKLPLALNKLVKLLYLNIEDTSCLVRIPRNLLSSLQLLQILRMFRCEYLLKLEESRVLVEEVLLLTRLSVLSITVRDAAALQQLPSCIHALDLSSFTGAQSLDISSFTELRNLRVYKSKSLEEFNVDSMIRGGEAKATSSSLYTSTIVNEPSFNSLRETEFAHCHRLLHLTWLILAPNLRILKIFHCRGITEIISAEKLREIPEADGRIQNLFGKLEVLVCYWAPALKSIYWNALPFPSLKSISVTGCPSLKRLPLNSNSAKDCNLVIEGPEDWRNNIEWEDEATKSTFLPCFETS